MQNYSEYIEINPDKRFGRPVVKGTRISVVDILNWLASGMNVQEIINEYPELNRKQIMACLSYAADRERCYQV